MMKRRVIFAVFSTCALIVAFAARLRADSPDARFSAAGSPGGIQDAVTGLIWEQPDDGNQYTWADAKTHCSTPWRLPSVEELTTLIDPRAAPTTLSMDPIFSGAGLEFYWSTTVVSGSSTQAWGVYFNGGAADIGTQTDTHRARCVR